MIEVYPVGHGVKGAVYSLLWTGESTHTCTCGGKYRLCALEGVGRVWVAMEFRALLVWIWRC